MTKLNTFSVQEGLNRLKLYDSKINRSISENELYFLVTDSGKLKQKTKQTKEDLEEQAKATFQKTMDLIDNRNKLKQAIVQSNATTKVTIGDVQYTVAEAIETKSSIEYKQNLLTKLKQTYRKQELGASNYNDSIKNNHEKKVNTLLSTDSDNKDGLETLINQMALLAESELLMVNEYPLVKNTTNIDMINILEEEIESFLSEVDYKLTESNVITKISL